MLFRQVIAALAINAITCAVQFGTLMSDSTKSSGEFAAGLRLVGHECFWDRVETSDGVWSQDELNWKLTERNAFLAAGMKLVLEPGIHEPPAYVSALPNGMFVSQNGTTSGINVVWSSEVRSRVERYITKLAETLDFSKYDAIRLGAGGNVEVLYPADNLFWCYDPVAQSSCPYPGWAPGNLNTSVPALNSTQVAQWYDWYLDSLISEIAWRRDLYRSLNFSGTFHLVMPGVGAVPCIAEQAVDSALVQYPDVMGRGAAWYWLLSRLVKTMGSDDLVAWCSSTAEALRQNDTSQPTDPSVDPSSQELNTWSSMRLFTYYADRLGLGKGGENPGYGDSENYGVPMLHASIAQIIAGNWSAFAWAHDADLYTPGHNISLQDYGQAIQRVNG